MALRSLSYRVPVEKQVTDPGIMFKTAYDKKNDYMRIYLVFNIETFEYLGSPERVELYIDEKEKKIVIEAQLPNTESGKTIFNRGPRKAISVNTKPERENITRLGLLKGKGLPSFNDEDDHSISGKSIAFDF